MTTLASAGTWFAETALSGTLLLAIPVALLAGLVSFFSPCVLPLVPGYLSFVTGLTGAEMAEVTTRGSAGNTSDTAAGTANRHRGRLLAGAVLFVLGFTAVFFAFGAIAGTAGVFLREHLDVIIRVFGAVLVVLGLVFAGVLPWFQRDIRALHRVRGVGLAAAPLLGAVFGLGWTPCIGPTMSAVLTLALDSGRASRGGLLMVFYGLGLGIPFVLAALGYKRLLRASSWIRRHPRVVSSVGGGLLVVLGVAMLTGLWSSFISTAQGWVSGFGETAV